jgi:hypothetical protein
MSKELRKEEMRQALFGPSGASLSQVIPVKSDELASEVKPRPMTKPLSPKLRVTLHVSKEFEGAVEVFVYDTKSGVKAICRQSRAALAAPCSVAIFLCRCTTSLMTNRINFSTKTGSRLACTASFVRRSY